MSEDDLEWLKEQWLQWGDETMITKGNRIIAVYPGAIDEARTLLKPTIPAVGFYDIPIHDEIELEKIL